jgi:glycosyltransferase involved in cell wall biosynthesis
MRISVVTPSFNMAPYLEDTIASVIGNLRPGDEYFVVDGGSTDGSADIIRRHATSLTGWVSEKDAGYADALAKGFDRATGDILCWINTGDLYLSGAFDAARRAFADDRDMIFGDDFYIDQNNKILAYSRGWVPDLRMAMLYGGWTPLQDACFWRRSLYQGIGGLIARCATLRIMICSCGWRWPAAPATYRSPSALSGGMLGRSRSPAPRPTRTSVVESELGKSRHIGVHRRSRRFIAGSTGWP